MKQLLSIIIATILSLFSTAVMSYISMAAPIGPWIAPTLVLLGFIIFMLIRQSTKIDIQALASTVIAGSVGGILATGFGFSFPTLYFLDPTLFNQWLASPWYFAMATAGLALAAGSFGFVIADTIEHKLLEEQQLSFPIGQLVYKMIAAGNQVRKALQLVIGFVVSIFFSILQAGVGMFTAFIPRTLLLISSHKFSIHGVAIVFPSIRFDLAPIWWAVGFVTGHVIALPLFAGALVRIFLVDPLNVWLFPHVSPISFILAFCTGLIISSTLPGLISGVHHLYRFLLREKQVALYTPRTFNVRLFVSWSSTLLICILFLTAMGLSLYAQLYLILFTIICVYQMVVIAGKTGLALLGRFATLIMVPAMFLFNTSVAQIMIIATFVEVAGGVATDILCGRKIAQLAQIKPSQARWYQLLGLIISVLVIGVVFMLLIKQFGLGSDQLFAQKAQARALLINVREFDFASLGYVLVFGALVGHLLNKIKINAMMALGGILMPLNITLGLVTGGALAMLSKEKEEWYPFWSGVYAAASLWMLVKAVA